MSSVPKKIDPELAREAKSIVALAFRNGPIEDVHSGIACPMCAGKPEYSHITQEEMKRIMKQAVDTVYKLLWLRDYEPHQYEDQIRFASLYTKRWDEPQVGGRKRNPEHSTSLSNQVR